MNLDRVTITGADDSVDPQAIADLHDEFPFVEFGLLFSRKHQGGPRFPSRGWVDRLLSLDGRARRLSAHLCGQYVRDIAGGYWTWFSDFKAAAPFFDRIQLNFHGDVHQITGLVMPMPWQYILQVDGVNDAWIRTLCQPYFDGRNTFVPLFDTSGGAGVLPKAWPSAWTGVYCGYAGGLGPDNVVEQVMKIGELGDVNCAFWVDMERRVRSEDDRMFDLTKVRSVLLAVKPYVGVPFGVQPA